MAEDAETVDSASLLIVFGLVQLSKEEKTHDETFLQLIFPKSIEQHCSAGQQRCAAGQHRCCGGLQNAAQVCINAGPVAKGGKTGNRICLLIVLRSLQLCTVLLPFFLKK